MFASKLQNFNKLSICALTHLTSSRGFHAGAINLINKNFINIDFKSLQKYKDIHGDLLIPQSYDLMLETENTGPQGYKLGKHAKFIRSTAKSNPSRISSVDKARLNDMSFVWNSNDEKFRRIILALLHYRKLYGNTIVPVCYVVPEDDEDWPLDQRGFKLGSKLRNVVARRIAPERLEYMESLGLSADGLQDQLAAMLKDVLSIYKQVHSISEGTSFIVPRDFIIPSAAPWPQYTWGIPLGFRIHNVRIRGDFQEYHEEFRSLGLDFELKKGGRRRNMI